MAQKASSPFSFEWLTSKALVPGIERSQLVKEIELIHQSYIQRASSATFKIDHFNERSVSAYLLYFAATNAAKWFAVISKIPLVHQKELAILPFCDVGAGPGIFTLCWWSWKKTILPHVSESEIVSHPSILVLERDHWMQQQARALLKDDIATFKLKKSLRELSDQECQEQQNGILFFGHSFNELSDEEVEKLRVTLNPKYILCIEPGTKEVFARIRIWREHLLKLGYQCLYPCPSLHVATCPMSQEDWCHQILTLSHDPQLESLCQVLKKDRREAPVIFHCYVKGEKRGGEVGELSRTKRLVRTPRSLKGLWQFQYCEQVPGGDDTALLQLTNDQLQKRLLDRQTEKIIEQLRSGDECLSLIESVGKKKNFPTS